MQGELGTNKAAVARALTLSAAAFEVSVADIVGPSRRVPVPLARSVCITLLIRHARFTWSMAATAMGRRNHTTCGHALNTLEDRIATEETTRTIFTKIVAEFSTPTP